MDVLRVKLCASNLVREKRPYTIYEIEVRSATLSWVIYKRYSHFHSLHQELVEAEVKDVKLPVLPPKRLTRSLAPEFVEKRKQELQGLPWNFLY